MTYLLFPDNTVLINFALIHRLDLLESLVNGNGRWTITIEAECAASSRYDGLGDLALVPGFLGKPLVPTGSERVDTGTYRRVLATPGDKPTDHLGEAETLAIMLSRSLHAIFVTDDGSASQLFLNEGVTTYNTLDLLRLAVRARFLPDAEAWTFVLLLRGRDRVSGDHVQNQEAFERWCQQ